MVVRRKAKRTPDHAVFRTGLCLGQAVAADGFVRLEPLLLWRKKKVRLLEDAAPAFGRGCA